MRGITLSLLQALSANQSCIAMNLEHLSLNIQVHFTRQSPLKSCRSRNYRKIFNHNINPVDLSFVYSDPLEKGE
jgi:hypothetical protein